MTRSNQLADRLGIPTIDHVPVLWLWIISMSSAVVVDAGDELATRVNISNWKSWVGQAMLVLFQKNERTSMQWAMGTDAMVLNWGNSTQLFFSILRHWVCNGYRWHRVTVHSTTNCTNSIQIRVEAHHFQSPIIRRGLLNYVCCVLLQQEDNFFYLINNEAPMFIKIFITNINKAESLWRCWGSCCTPASAFHKVQQNIFFRTSSSLPYGGCNKNPNHLFSVI